MFSTSAAGEPVRICSGLIDLGCEQAHLFGLRYHIAWDTLSPTSTRRLADPLSLFTHYLDKVYDRDCVSATIVQWAQWRETSHSTLLLALVLKHVSTNFALKTSLWKCQCLTIQMPISNVLFFFYGWLSLPHKHSFGSRRFKSNQNIMKALTIYCTNRKWNFTNHPLHTYYYDQLLNSIIKFSSL